MKTIKIIILFTIAVSFHACKKGPVDPGENNLINPYLKEIDFSDPKENGHNFYMGVWSGNNIYTIDQLARFIIDNNYSAVDDTILLDIGIYEKHWTYIDANTSGTEILLVDSRYGDVSSGALYEYKVQTSELNLIIAKTENVSSARYFPGDDNKIIYYKYGDSTYAGAGYHLYNKLLNRDSLLFSYLSLARQSEMLNGFDVHPDGNKLLIPISMSTQTNWRLPKLGIILLNEQRIDTLNVNFELDGPRTGLWVRYNHDASKILYCCFPHGSYTSTTNGSSEVGIIETATLLKTILDVNTNDEGPSSVQLAPNWSPDENAIVFGSGQVFYDGVAGRRHLYILTKIN